jgi:hypothetical protein
MQKIVARKDIGENHLETVRKGEKAPLTTQFFAKTFLLFRVFSMISIEHPRRK